MQLVIYLGPLGVSPDWLSWGRSGPNLWPASMTSLTSFSCGCLMSNWMQGVGGDSVPVIKLLISQCCCESVENNRWPLCFCPSSTNPNGFAMKVLGLYSFPSPFFCHSAYQTVASFSLGPSVFSRVQWGLLSHCQLLSFAVSGCWIRIWNVPSGLFFFDATPIYTYSDNEGAHCLEPLAHLSLCCSHISIKQVPLCLSWLVAFLCKEILKRLCTEIRLNQLLFKETKKNSPCLNPWGGGRAATNFW